MGQFSRFSMEAWVNRAKVELRGAGVDESPQCYKRLDDVLRYHEGTIRAIHRLTPVGVEMADRDIRP